MVPKLHFPLSIPLMGPHISLWRKPPRRLQVAANIATRSLRSCPKVSEVSKRFKAFMLSASLVNASRTGSSYIRRGIVWAHEHQSTALSTGKQPSLNKSDLS